jgi:hypothetical protein
MAISSSVQVVGAVAAAGAAIFVLLSRKAMHVATQNRSFKLTLDYGSAISEAVLSAVLERLPGVTSFQYDGKRVLSVSGLVPISMVVSRFTKVGTHFELAGEPEVLVNVPPREALAARRALLHHPSVSSVHLNPK